MALVSGSLTERQREAVMLYFLHDKTQEEVAEIMGINRRVVSQHVWHPAQRSAGGRCHRPSADPVSEAGNRCRCLKAIEPERRSGDEFD